MREYPIYVRKCCRGFSHKKQKICLFLLASKAREKTKATPPKKSGLCDF